MGNAPIKKKPRVTFCSSVCMDRYEEETKRYDHIMKVYKEYQLGNKNMKEKLAHLVLAFLKRCHENVNVVAEEKHAKRVRTVCIISIETFTGLVTEKQSHALLQSCVALTLMNNY